MTQWTQVGAESGRLTLHEDGIITWQENKTNPLPGDAVAKIIKGDTPLSPLVQLHLDADAQITDAEKETVLTTVREWLDGHIKTVLAPLFTLKNENEYPLEGAAKDIANILFDNMGVVHRSEIEKFVPELNADIRVNMRRKRIKMGPVLVFLPELVKPAGVNMRALLWGIWNDKDLPMQRPADGRVSVAVDVDNVDRHFYRSIGYPVFGNLAIRIDMLDRVITDIYDSSKDWKFRAKHQHMEWLGCGEDDLYGILKSMGFTQIKTDKDDVSTDTLVEEVKNTEVTEENAEKTEETTDKTDETAVISQSKPELSEFWLKKGKISDRPKPKFVKNTYKTDDKAKKSYKKPSSKPKKKDFGAKTYSAKAKDDEIDADSPFAILQQLKK